MLSLRGRANFRRRPEPLPGRAPRQREFTQAEIEFFCQPGDKKFEKFALIKHLRLQLLSSPLQLEGKPAAERTLEEAVASGTIANEVRPGGGLPCAPGPGWGWGWGGGYTE